MPGSKYTDKQERQAKHIEESYEDKGVSEKEAKSRAWATVNKQDGGGKKGKSAGEKRKATSSKSTSGRKRSSATNSSTSKKKATAGRKGGKARARKAA